MDNFVDNLSKEKQKVSQRTKSIPITGGVKNVTETKVVTLPSGKKIKRKKFTGLRSLGNTLLSGIFPLLPAMKRMLKSRGYNVQGMQNKTIAANFHNEFLTKKENKTSNFEEINISDFENHPYFKLPETAQVDNIGLDTVSSVIGGVVNFFKNAKAKKAAAKLAKLNLLHVLTPAEITAAKEAEKVTKELEKKVEAEKPETKKDAGNMKKYIIYGVVALVLIVVIYMVTKK